MAERWTESRHWGQEHYRSKKRKERFLLNLHLKKTTKGQCNSSRARRVGAQVDRWEQAKPLNKYYTREESSSWHMIALLALQRIFLLTISGHLHNNLERSIKEIVFTFNRWGNWGTKKGMTYLRPLSWLVSKQNSNLPEQTPRPGGSVSQIGINEWTVH